MAHGVPRAAHFGESRVVDTANRPLILVTGSTGYIGGRLVPRLLELGHRVRCLVRDPVRLQGRPWCDAVEIVAGDVLQPESLAPAMRDVSAAYYLVHSLAGGADFHERDLTAARNFAAAAQAAGVRRILYLGGLADAASGLSEHLRSRQQTGDCLRGAGVPVTEFRAGVIVGSGSLSFEMIRYLTERVPAGCTRGPNPSACGTSWSISRRRSRSPRARDASSRSAGRTSSPMAR